MSGLKGMKIGFIGLGLMGKPMARNLARAGAEMIVHNRSQAPVDELVNEGMTAGGSPDKVAAAAEIVICMLTDTPAVEKVIMDAEDGIIAGITPDTLIIDMSTSKVPATRQMAQAIEAKGGLYADAPVSGGTIGAQGGSLTIMAGGSEEAFERARPVLDVLGQKITHVGGVGPGQARGDVRPPGADPAVEVGTDLRTNPFVVLVLGALGDVEPRLRPHGKVHRGPV